MSYTTDCDLRARQYLGVFEDGIELRVACAVLRRVKRGACSSLKYTYNSPTVTMCDEAMSAMKGSDTDGYTPQPPALQARPEYQQEAAYKK